MPSVRFSDDTIIQENYEIPQLHHAIWLGGEIHKDYADHLIYLVSVREKMGLPPVKLWTDASSREANAKLFCDTPGITIESIEDLLNDFLNDAELDLSEEERVDFIKCILFEYISPCNYAAIADYLRILILYKHGGQYADTDTFLNMFYGLEYLKDFLKMLPDKHLSMLFDRASPRTASEFVLNHMHGEDAEKWKEFQKKNRDSYSFSINITSIARTGIAHSLRNNNYIIAAKGHPALRECMKMMIEEMKEVHSVSEECFNKDYATWKNLPNSLSKELPPGYSEEHLTKQFFKSERAWRCSKKSSKLLSYSLIGHVPQGTSEIDKFLARNYLTEFLLIESGAGCIEKNLAPAIRKLTVELGPGCLHGVTEEWLGFLEKRSIPVEGNKVFMEEVGKIFDLRRCDNTWLSRRKVEIVNEFDPCLEEAVLSYEQIVEPLTFSTIRQEMENHATAKTGVTGLLNEIKQRHLCSNC